MAFGHFGNAYGKYNGNNGCQAFRNSCNSKAYCNHEGFLYQTGVDSVGAPYAESKDKCADAQYHVGKDFTELAQFFLKRGFAFACFCNSGCDFAHFGIHAGAYNNSLAAAIYNGGAVIKHVFAVAQRNVFLVAKGKGINLFVYRYGFAGEGCFFNLQACTFNNARVGRNSVACFQRDNVAGNEVFTFYGNKVAVAVNFGSCGGHFLQCFNGFFGFAFLNNAEHRVQNNNEHDDKYGNRGFTGQIVGDARYNGCYHQNNQHRIRQLL